MSEREAWRPSNGPASNPLTCGVLQRGCQCAAHSLTRVTGTTGTARDELPRDSAAAPRPLSPAALVEDGVLERAVVQVAQVHAHHCYCRRTAHGRQRGMGTRTRWAHSRPQAGRCAHSHEEEELVSRVDISHDSQTRASTTAHCTPSHLLTQPTSQTSQATPRRPSSAPTSSSTSTSTACTDSGHAMTPSFGERSSWTPRSASRGSVC